MKTVFDVVRKPLVIGALVLSILIVVGVYFGSHWYYGDVEPVPEHPLTLESIPPRVHQDTSVTNSHYTKSLESESVSDVRESSNDEAITILDEIDGELAAVLVDDTPLSSATEGFPQVPDGFPLTPIWLRSGYQKGDSYQHELIYRVLIKLWNQGDRDFVNGIYSHDYNKVYPLYPDVMYVEWEDEEVAGPDGPLTIQVISGVLGTEPRFFMLTDFITGAWETKYPGVALIDMGTAGIDPETFLSDNE